MQKTFTPDNPDSLQWLHDLTLLGYEENIIINLEHGVEIVFYYEHSDGTPAYGGSWFVLGIGVKPGYQITYHYPMEYWDKCKFKELEKAPEYDGHSPADVLHRLIHCNLF